MVFQALTSMTGSFSALRSATQRAGGVSAMMPLMAGSTAAQVTWGRVL